MIVPIVSSRPLAQILSQLNLRPIIRQRNTHQSPRLHAAIDARVAQRREHKLVDSEVQVSVLGNSELHNTSQRNPHNTHSLSPSRTHRINPIQPRIPNKRIHSPISGVENRHSILLHVAMVDETVRVRLHSVGNARLAVVVDRALR
jgi:hypothetical protein